MGMLYAQQGDVPHATEYLRKALELRPDYPEALNNLGVLFVRTQKYRGGRRTIQVWNPRGTGF